MSVIDFESIKTKLSQDTNVMQLWLQDLEDVPAFPDSPTDEDLMIYISFAAQSEGYIPETDYPRCYFSLPPVSNLLKLKSISEDEDDTFI